MTHLLTKLFLPLRCLVGNTTGSKIPRKDSKRVDVVNRARLRPKHAETKMSICDTFNTILEIIQGIIK